MDTSIAFGLIGSAASILSLAYAFYQTNEKKKLREHIASEAWSLYSKADNASGAVQAALNAYENKYSSNLDADVLKVLSKSDAFCQDVFKDSIKQIRFAEQKFDVYTVERWVMEGRVSKANANLFKQISTTAVSAIKNR